jgi:hypothetical protein
MPGTNPLFEKSKTNNDISSNYIHYHKDGSIRAKGKKINDVP